MLRLHPQPKVEIKLANDDWTRGKMIENIRWRENYKKWSSKLDSMLSN